MRQAGHVIDVRHTQATKDYADQADPAMGLADCNTQRKLSDLGIAQANQIGQAITRLGIPVGPRITSQYCRAWQITELAFGRYQQSDQLNVLPFETDTDAEVAPMKSAEMPLPTA